MNKRLERLLTDLADPQIDVCIDHPRLQQQLRAMLDALGGPQFAMAFFKELDRELKNNKRAKLLFHY